MTCVSNFCNVGFVVWVSSEMKSLGETPHEVAQRLRSLAEGVANPQDANDIRRYADWLERELDADEVLDEQQEPLPRQHKGNS